MENDSPQKYLNTLASAAGATIEVTDHTQDKKVLMCKLQIENFELYVLLLRGDEVSSSDYFAYSLSGTGLPREMYADTPRNGFTVKSRSEEILENSEKMITKKLTFHAKPSLLNKNAGYIELSIDGQQTKLKQDKNWLSLPVS